MLTTFGQDDVVLEALRAGADGFLLKDTRTEDLLAAVHAVAGGEALLTSREREVLLLMARGRSNAEIGQEPFISHGTVKTHVGALLAKLGVRDRVQAVVLAHECGITSA